jgi:hypothetical protein
VKAASMTIPILMVIPRQWHYIPAGHFRPNDDLLKSRAIPQQVAGQFAPAMMSTLRAVQDSE